LWISFPWEIQENTGGQGGRLSRILVVSWKTPTFNSQKATERKILKVVVGTGFEPVKA
jgi:hypothetical protein